MCNYITLINKFPLAGSRVDNACVQEWHGVHSKYANVQQSYQRCRKCSQALTSISQRCTICSCFIAKLGHSLGHVVHIQVVSNCYMYSVQIWKPLGRMSEQASGQLGHNALTSCDASSTDTGYHS